MWLLRSVIAETTVISSITIPFYLVHTFELEQCFHLLSVQGDNHSLGFLFRLSELTISNFITKRSGKTTYRFVTFHYIITKSRVTSSPWTLIIWSNDRLITDLFWTSTFLVTLYLSVLLVVREMIRAYFGTRHLTYGFQLELNCHQKLTKNVKAQPLPSTRVLNDTVRLSCICAQKHRATRQQNLSW